MHTTLNSHRVCLASPVASRFGFGSPWFSARTPRVLTQQCVQQLARENAARRKREQMKPAGDRS